MSLRDTTRRHPVWPGSLQQAIRGRRFGAPGLPRCPKIRITRQYCLHPTVGEAEPQEEMAGDAGMRGVRPITSFLLLRYRLHSFKVGAETLGHQWNDGGHLIAPN